MRTGQTCLASLERPFITMCAQCTTSMVPTFSQRAPQTCFNICSSPCFADSFEAFHKCSAPCRVTGPIFLGNAKIISYLCVAVGCARDHLLWIRLSLTAWANGSWSEFDSRTRAARGCVIKRQLVISLHAHAFRDVHRSSIRHSVDWTLGAVAGRSARHVSACNTPFCEFKCKPSNGRNLMGTDYTL